MPIEDISYLKQHSVKETIIVFADSSKRDRYQYPTPAHYVVSFDEPFYNVYGVEVLDASIPRTMYVVDTHTNLLVLYVGIGLLTTPLYPAFDPNSLSGIERFEIRITPQDYQTLEQLIDELETLLKIHGINVYALSSDVPSQKSKLKFVGTKAPFCFDMNASTCREVLGFDEHSLEQASLHAVDAVYTKHRMMEPMLPDIDCDPSITLDKYDTYTTYYQARRAVCASTERERPRTNERLYGSVASPLSLESSVDVFVLHEVSEDAAQTFLEFESSSQHIAMRFSFQELQMVDDFFEIAYAVFEFSGSTAILGKTVNYAMYERNVSNSQEDQPFGLPMYSGSFSIISDADVNAFLASQNDITNVPPGYYGILGTSQTQPLIFSGGNTAYWIDLSTPDGGGDLQIRVHPSRVTLFDPIFDSTDFVIKSTTAPDSAYTILTQNPDNSTMEFVASPTDATSIGRFINYTFYGFFNLNQTTYTIIPPGIVSLVGERYVIMRCPEIDSNAQMGYAYTQTTPGLALFKLGVLGYSETRFDFSSIKQKEFHPIGKMDKLTFRFERLDGQLYDFKGVNHHLLIAVKYLIPSPDATELARDMLSSTLNPNYNPDFMSFLLKHKERSDEEDSESDEPSVTRTREAEYSTSSSSSEN